MSLPRRLASSRSVLSCCALRSFSITMSSSPAFGIPEKPITFAGVEGPASFMFAPVSLTSPFTLPEKSPQMNAWPIFSVPIFTMTVAVGPRPCSTCASMTDARAGTFEFALSSRTSASSKIISSRCSMPWFFTAETGHTIVSPPQSSGWSPFSWSCPFTRSMFAPGRSIFVMATMIFTFAARAWLSASSVCGMMPSLASTTSTTMSVTVAPRERMAVNAAARACRGK